MTFEITVFRKSNGLLSKRIALKAGEVDADGSACRMAGGTARRVKLDGIDSFAKLIGDMKSNEAPVLGRLRADLPDSVTVILKRDLNSATARNVISRTTEFLHFAERQAAFMLLDHDGKGMPNEVADKLKELGGFWSAVITVAPHLASAARVTRRSTSAGLYRKGTGKRFSGSANSHEYIAVADGTDIERALKALHNRLWLAGLGYHAVGAAGQLLDRSIVDAAVYGPERLVFEGAPIVEPPLAQDASVRRPQVHDGLVIDTVQAIPALTEEEARRLAALKAEAARRLKPAAAAARKAWVVEFVAKRGHSEADAERIAAAATDKHVLAPEFELEFDELGACTVADVLADPDTHVGETLADPLEGVAYGRGKAKVLKQRDGRLMIHSYAHGEINYQLEGQGVTLDDFHAYMPMASSYIYAPARDMWPAANVNVRIPPVALLDADGDPLLDAKGKPKFISASEWLGRYRPVEQWTWMPGMAMLISGWLISEGGWIRRNGVTVFNQYRPPTLARGDPDKAGPWLEHVRKVYPDDAEHIIKWLAHRVQRPDEKINHALVLGGAQGIGKDTLLEPVKRAIGPWNFADVTPQHVLGRFNGYVKSVILRISEARDLGEFDRFKFYDHLKVYTAAPPDVLRVDEKNVKEYNVPNVSGVIITTNHKTDGIHLPADDRRHYVGWSELSKDDFTQDYWNDLWGWINSGGDGHVAAYLSELDISDFDQNAPPPKTPAWWSIVDAARAPEDAELADVLDQLGNPKAVSLDEIKWKARGNILTWLTEHKNRRAIPHRLEACGYVAVRNDVAKDGYWRVYDKRQAIYARAELALHERIAAAKDLIARAERERGEDVRAAQARMEARGLRPQPRR